jgi:hypothetical protein
MGGPQDRTYLVNPRHMKVRYPRNINDDDLASCDDTSIPPTDTPTDMSYFLQRIRLAEICRTIVDKLPLDGGDINDLTDDQVHAIDRLFEDALASFPSSFVLDSPIPPNAPANFGLQRQVIHVAFHARRARLYLPFLMPGIADSDRRYQCFRTTCLNSASLVIDIASVLLQESLDDHIGSMDAARASRGPVPHRSSTVISHLFIACAVLATDPSLSAGTAKSNSETEQRRAVLANACRLLEKAGEECAMAASLVRSLISVLKRHHVHGVNDSHGREASDVPVAVPLTMGQPGVERTVHDGPQDQMVPAYGAALEGQSVPADSSNGYDDTLGLPGILEDFIATMSVGDEWSRVFADLDSFKDLY